MQESGKENMAAFQTRETSGPLCLFSLPSCSPTTLTIRHHFSSLETRTSNATRLMLQNGRIASGRDAQQNPIVLDYSPERGHAPALPLSVRIDALTRRVAFLCHELGNCRPDGEIRNGIVPQLQAYATLIKIDFMMRSKIAGVYLPSHTEPRFPPGLLQQRCIYCGTLPHD